MASTDLVRMANQIAANFAYLDPEEAAISLAAHLRSFWAPPMRSELISLAVSGEPSLGALVLRACQLLDPGAPVGATPSMETAAGPA